MSRVGVRGRVPETALEKLRAEHEVEPWQGRSQLAARSSCAE